MSRRLILAWPLYAGSNAQYTCIHRPIIVLHACSTLSVLRVSLHHHRLPSFYVFSVVSNRLSLHLQVALHIVSFFDVPFLLITKDRPLNAINDFRGLVQYKSVPLEVLLLCSPLLAKSQFVSNLFDKVIEIDVGNVSL